MAHITFDYSKVLDKKLEKNEGKRYDRKEEILEE